jgi:hypothetical protein
VAPYVLAGGLVGYLIGRRRGRIKTEKRLLPIQAKLEKEVKELEQQIIRREDKIRNLTREQLATRPEAGQQMMQRLAERQSVAPQRAEAPAQNIVEQLQAASQTVPERAVAERPALIPPERVGRVLFAGERPVIVERLKTPEKPKPVELLTIPELLKIAEKIKIETSDVRRLYETNRLDDIGLRRVVREYLKGERYERTIRDNLKTTPEYAFPERDPMQQPDPSTPVPAAGYRQANPGSSMPPSSVNTTPAYSQNPMQPNSSPLPPQPANVQAKKSKAAPVALITSVVVIAVAILLFILTR